MEVQQDSSETQQPESSGGIIIEIKVDASGAMSVGVEPMQEEHGGEEEYQPVANMQELFKLIKQLVAGGSLQGSTEQDQSQMDEGYDSRG